MLDPENLIFHDVVPRIVLLLITLHTVNYSVNNNHQIINYPHEYEVTVVVTR
jgi:hypothetical protein